jgi:casein kinase 1
MASHSHPSSTANIVGAHYRVGKKIGEGSFGVIFEGELSLPFVLCLQLTAQIFIGTNLLNSQTVAIKFVRCLSNSPTRQITPSCCAVIGTEEG